MNGSTGTRSEIGVRAIAVACVILMIGLFSACYSVVERNDMLGTWEANEDGRSARIYVHGDGTMQVENVPRVAVSERFSSGELEVLDWADTINLDARWSFLEATSESFSQGRISVSFEESDSPRSLRLVPLSGELQLYYGDAELGQHLAFRKVQGALTPGPSTLGRTALVGTWTSDGAGTLELSDEGSFTMVGVPARLLAELALGEVSEFSGQWMFVEEVLPLHDDSFISLSLDPKFQTPSGSFISLGLTLIVTEDGYSLVMSDGQFRWDKN